MYVLYDDWHGSLQSQTGMADSSHNWYGRLQSQTGKVDSSHRLAW